MPSITKMIRPKLRLKLNSHEIMIPFLTGIIAIAVCNSKNQNPRSDAGMKIAPLFRTAIRLILRRQIFENRNYSCGTRINPEPTYIDLCTEQLKL